MLVSTLQQTHHIFLTLFLFFIFIIVREAELLHQLINAIQFGVHPALLFSIKGAALFQTFQQRVGRSSFSSNSSSACGESIGFSLFGLCCLGAGALLSLTPSGIGFCYPRADLAPDAVFYPLKPHRRRSRDCLPRGHDVSSAVCDRELPDLTLHATCGRICHGWRMSVFS